MDNSGIYILGVVINTLLVLSGWIFLYVNTNRASKRSEVRGLLDKAIGIAREVGEKGSGAWGEDVANKQQVILALTRSIEDVEKYAEMVECDSFLGDVRPKIRELRKCVTYDYVGESVSNQRSYMIWRATQDVIFSFEEFFVRSYH